MGYIFNDISFLVIVQQFDISLWVIPVNIIVLRFGQFFLKSLKQYLRKNKKSRK